MEDERAVKRRNRENGACFLRTRRHTAARGKRKRLPQQAMTAAEPAVPAKETATGPGAAAGVETDAQGSWFAPLPVHEYLQDVRNAVPDKIPEENPCPPDYALGELSVACGPAVRFLGTHENNSDSYRGSVLLVVRDYAGAEGTAPGIEFRLGPAHESDGPVGGGEFLKVAATATELIHQEQQFSFFRYSFTFELTQYEQRVRYSFDGLSRPHFQFFLPTAAQSMNVMSFSCNGFSLGTDTATFKGSLWLDVLRKHNRPNFHYHVMIGGGDQIYADSIKNISHEFNAWLKHKHIHSADKLTPKLEASFDDYYLNRYIEWFGKGYWAGTAGRTIQTALPIALAAIPQVNIYDDHDIIDGFGSYTDVTMRQAIFQGVGQHAFRYYMLFQHHTPYRESPKNEPSWIMGKAPSPYITEPSRSVYTRLGASIGFLGLDCRTERTKHQIVTQSTYDLAFKRVEQEILDSKHAGKPIKHLYVLLGVPTCYPRMVFLERLIDSPLFYPIILLARKGIIAHSLVNEFDGQVELLDDMNDHWCSHTHKKERNKLMKKMIDFGKAYDVRITILSGDVHLCCASRFRGTSEISQANPRNDPSFITNLISSAIVNAPPPDGMAKFLSMRARKHRFQKGVVEDMIPLFSVEPGSGKHRSHELFMNKRNYSDLIPVANIPTDLLLQRYGDTATDKFYVPGVVGDKITFSNKTDNIAAASKTNGPIGYPLDPDGVVATLRVEADMTDVNSETGAYELLVPSLEVKK